jgi:CelD/BcsL family acetyltransferase involved in cellulose biosynthesis
MCPEAAMPITLAQPPCPRTSEDALHVTVEPIDTAGHGRLTRRYWDWRALYDSDPAAYAFQHPDVVLAELRHNRATFPSPALLIAEQHDRVVGLGALIPKVVATARLGGVGLSWTWQGLRLAGNRWLLRDANRAAEAALTQAALHYVRDSGARFLLLEDLEVDTPLAESLRTIGREWLTWHHAGIQRRWRIQLPRTRTDYWERFSKKTLSTMRRKLKKFGSTRLERITDIAQVPHFLEVAHAVSLQTWQTRQFGLRIRNDSAELEVYSQLAQHGLLRSYLWYSNEQPVAFLVGNQDKTCFHYEEVGYATPFARFSPGQMLLVQVLDDLFAHQRPEWFDFGGGDADYKQFFATHESRSGTVWLLPPTAVNRLAVGHLRSCRLARQAARSAIRLAGWAQRARHWVRYAGIPTGRSSPRPASHAADDGD